MTGAATATGAGVAERAVTPASASVKAAFNARHGGVSGLARLSHDALLPLYLATDEAKELSASFRERRKPDSDKFGH